jgi:hypothetical protein
MRLSHHPSKLNNEDMHCCGLFKNQTAMQPLSTTALLHHSIPAVYPSLH